MPDEILHAGAAAFQVTPDQPWLGPRLPVRGDHLYRLSCEVAASGNGLWAILPYDQLGYPLPADTHSGIDATRGWAPLRSCFRGLPGAVAGQICLKSLAGSMTVRDLKIEEINRDAVRRWADAVAAELPAIGYQPPSGRHRFLARTLAALHSGQPQRWVLAGDSIMQDLWASFFDLLLDAYPQAQLALIPSVGGSKGSWHFRQDLHFQGGIRELAPDLLLFGGISERFGLRPVREFFARVHAELDCELLYVLGPLGPDTRALHPDQGADAAKQLQQHRDRLAGAAALARLCGETHTACADLATPWDAYLRASGKPDQWFNRDRHHGNDRGKHAAARLLAAFFAPEV